MEVSKENIINESTKETEKAGSGFEISPEQVGGIAAELSKINEAITHDIPIKIYEVENLNKLAGNIKIDVGGEIMTVEEAEKIPNLKRNMEIWKEMSEGKFRNTVELTRITPKVSRYLQDENNVELRHLISATGLVLPARIRGFLNLASLTSAEGLVLPREIGGSLVMDALTSIEGLVLPSSVGGRLYFDRLPKNDIEELQKKYPEFWSRIV